MNSNTKQPTITQLVKCYFNEKTLEFNTCCFICWIDH